MNVFVTGTLFIIVLIGLTTLIIAFTPLREYIPGYSSTRLKRQATELTYKTDSLVTVLDYTNRYLNNVRMVLKGDIENNETNRDSLFERFKLDPSTVDLTPIREDLLLREDQLLMGAWNQKVKIRSGGKAKSAAQSMFGQDIAANVGCRAKTMNVDDIAAGFGRRNPNSAKGRERRGKKKKSSEKACGLRRYR